MIRCVILHIVPSIRPGLCLVTAAGSPLSWMSFSKYEKCKRIYEDLSSAILLFCWSYNYQSGLLTASDYVDMAGNQLHHNVQKFPNNDAIFRDHSSSKTHSQKCSVLVSGATRRTSISSPASTIARIKYHRLLWSVLESRLSSRLPLPSSLKQLEDVLHEEGYIIPLETIQNT